MGNLKKSDWFLLIFLVILIVLTILASQNPDVGAYFAIENWFNSEELGEVSFWAAVGFTMLACFLGALIPIPIPYAIPVTIFSYQWYMNVDSPWGMIIALVLFATVANTIGDMLDYAIGQGAEYVLSKDDPEMQTRWADIILKKPKAIPFIVFLFGLTPLPDSMLLVPLGMVKYSVKKTMFWMMIGKFFMMLFFALAGIYGMDWILDLLTGSDDGTGWISGMILLFAVWLMLVVMMKYKPKESEAPENQKVTANQEASINPEN